MVSHKLAEVSSERIDKLELRLQDWGVAGDYDAFEAWLAYQNKNILPFSGGYLEQPLWIRESFKRFNEVYNLHYFTRNRFFTPKAYLEGEMPSSPFSNLFTVKDSADG